MPIERVPSFIFVTTLVIMLTSFSALAQVSVKDLATSPPIRAWSLAEYLQEELGVKFDGSSPYLVVELENGSKAVFRSEAVDAWGSQAEVAGFRMSQYLGLQDLVPHTVVRKMAAREFPAGQWPYPETSRLGSLQSFLPARPVEQKDLEKADPDRVASIELLTFLMGRFDNHYGNCLVDGSGRVFIIDFENCLQHQKVRYGETPFVRYGKGRWDLPSAPKSSDFDFDGAEVLVKPTLLKLKEHLEPYRASWSGSIEGLHRQVLNSRDQSLRSVVWNHRLWIQVKVRSRHPAHTDRYPPELLRRLRALTIEVLERDILLPPFTRDHAFSILERRDQILEAYKQQKEG